MKKYILPLMVLVISGHLFAGTVSVSDAQNVALNFFKVTSPNAAAASSLTATLKMTYTEADNTNDFYVFDISPLPGFVIVAGNDNVLPVLAYSTESNFNTNYQKTGVSHWTYRVGTTIHQAVLANAMADAKIQGQWAAYRAGQNPSPQRSSSVAPMCHTVWDQESYFGGTPYIFNLFCPYNNTDQERALTGCVATAMAQIMKYWNYPTVGTGSRSYDCEYYGPPGPNYNYGTLSSDFAAHTYQWTQMPDSLFAPTGAQDTAVSQLMYDCGVSVNMYYGDDNEDGSGANALLAEEIPYGDTFCSQTAFSTYFGYERDTMMGIFDSSYTAGQWLALLENDLNVGRPILYEGDDSTQGGHAWVCDGYDVNNYLHMNWGWSGDDNGYFVFTNLTTGTGSNAFNPVVGEDALIGIVPIYVAEGINKVSNNFAFSVYPNPATDQVILETGETNNGAIWNIKNLLGQTVATGSVVSAQTTVNISGLSNGVYLVEMQQGEQTAVKKIVVSR